MRGALEREGWIWAAHRVRDVRWTKKLRPHVKKIVGFGGTVAEEVG